MTTLEILWVLSLPVAVLLALGLLGNRSRGLVALGLGVALVGLGGAGAKAWQQWRISRFEPVPATVVVSERGRRANDWRFAYEYESAGERRRGSRLSHRPRLRGRKDTDWLSQRFPVGAEFTAYVDPGDPTRSVVEREPSFGLPTGGAAVHAALLAAALGALRRGPGPAPGPRVTSPAPPAGSSSDPRSPGR